MANPRVAILGTGNVGGNLGVRFAQSEIGAVFGVREGGDPSELLGRAGPGASALPVAQAVAGADVVFLTVPADVAVQAAGTAGNLSGKILVDCTNPVKFDAGGPVLAPPAGGSVAASLQAAYPGARMVKAFNGLGAEFHLDPNVAGKPADMFMAGDDPEAKKVVGALADRVGFRAIDARPVRNAAHLEAMAVVWIHLAVKGSMGRHFTFQLTPRA